MSNKVNHVHIRFSDEELLHIQKAHQRFQEGHDGVIRLSEFLRNMVYAGCMLELGIMVPKGDEDEQDTQS